jgi:hypothetical protein
MTQARAKKPQQKPAAKKSKQPRAAAIKTTRAAAVEAAPEIDGERFDVLWHRFEDEAGLTSERLDQERQKLQDDIAALQAKIDEKNQALAAAEGRVDAAKQQMRLLIGARLSDEAILTAMRVEYKVRRVGGAKAKKDKEPLPPAADDDKQFVLDHLDAEGLSIAELKKLTDKDARFLKAALDSLVKEEKVVKSGERASAKFHLS